MEHGQSSGNGANGAAGNVLPVWLRHNQDYLIAWEGQYSSWTEQA